MTNGVLCIQGGDDMEQYYKVSEVIKLLSISKRTFYRWLEDDKIKIVKINGSTRIAESELKRLVGGE